MTYYHMSNVSIRQQKYVSFYEIINNAGKVLCKVEKKYWSLIAIRAFYEIKG